MLVWPQIEQSPHSCIIVPLFSPKAVSAALNHPKPLCLTFSVPAAQVSLNTPRLYPPPSIWLYCRCGMPGMSIGSPILFIHTHNQQCKHMPGLVLFHSRPSSSGRPGTDTCRHGQIGFNQTPVTAPAPGPCLPVCHCEQVVPRSQVPIRNFTSARPNLELTQRPLLCVGWHWGIMLPVWNIHAAPDLMKGHILLAPTFSAEEVWKWACRGVETDPACGCWESVSGS